MTFNDLYEAYPDFDVDVKREQELLAAHEIVVFQIWDPDELAFPFKQWTRFECLERLALHHTVDPAHLRAAYRGHQAPGYRLESAGFRCARTLPAK